MKISFLTPLIIVVFICFLECDKGLNPSDDESSFTGVRGIIFFQNWPPLDSLVDLRLVAFKNFPPANIFVEILSQEAYALPPITVDTTWFPFYADQIDFDFELPPGKYGYLVVAHRYGPNILADWQAVGQYDTNPDSLPSPFEVVEGELLDNIFISANFKNLPIQPF
jgi:hypothetical protein